MSDQTEYARAYQAIGEYFCAFSKLERGVGEAVKVVLGLQNHEAADFVVAALNDIGKRAALVRAAVAVAKNADESETSEEWKRSADDTMKAVFGCNDDRVLLAHAYLEPQADGSVGLTKQNLSSGQLKGRQESWNPKVLENKIKQVRDVTEQLQKITADLTTLTIRIPDLPDYLDLSSLGPSAGSSPLMAAAQLYYGGLPRPSSGGSQ
jgi:hypothetical protein